MVYCTLVCRCKLAQAQGSGCALAAEFLQRCLEEARQQPTEVAGGSGGAEAHPGVPGGLRPGQFVGGCSQLSVCVELYVGKSHPSGSHSGSPLLFCAPRWQRR